MVHSDKKKKAGEVYFLHVSFLKNHLSVQMCLSNVFPCFSCSAKKKKLTSFSILLTSVIDSISAEVKAPLS